MRLELHGVEDIIEIKKSLSVSEVIITHIEEDWGKSYDDYVILEQKYCGIKFVFQHDIAVFAVRKKFG